MTNNKDCASLEDLRLVLAGQLHELQRRVTFSRELDETIRLAKELVMFATWLEGQQCDIYSHGWPTEPLNKLQKKWLKKYAVQWVDTTQVDKIWDYIDS